MREACERNVMKRKHVARICGTCIGIALVAFFVFILSHHPKPYRPYQHLESEEIKRIRVMSGDIEMHSMSVSEIEEFVAMLVGVTHNGYAFGYKIGVGINLTYVFVLEYVDGRSESIGAEATGPEQPGYLFIDKRPYHADAETSYLISEKWSE